MNSYESDDELDRALFALPLEEPPQDLRASILAATIYRQPLTVKPWEVWALGALCAVLTWLLLLIARGHTPIVGSIDTYVDEAVRLFSNPQTLFWIALGGGAALWLSQLNLTFIPGASRAARR